MHLMATEWPPPLGFPLLRSLLSLRQPSTMTAHTVSATLHNPDAIHFIPNTDSAYVGIFFNARNPQRTSDVFVWLLPDRSMEIPVLFVGKVIYGTIGDKTGPYFSLPERFFVRTLPPCPSWSRVTDWLFRVKDVTVAEMAKIKTGFSVCLINQELLIADILHSEEPKTTTK